LLVKIPEDLVVRAIVTIVISPTMATGETAAAVILSVGVLAQAPAAKLLEEMVVRTMYSTAVIQIMVMEEMAE
jgi:hypothetical protein